jgi:tagatose-1,6-bisphosphate aldolase
MDSTTISLLNTMPWYAVACLLIIFYVLKDRREANKQHAEYIEMMEKRHQETLTMMAEDVNKRNESRNESQKYITDKLAEVSESVHDTSVCIKSINDKLDNIDDRLKTVENKVI